MPRIRTVKPDFWSSPDTARASLIARLTYIGMWNWADDYGRGTLNLKELEGFIFPNDDVAELSVGTSENFRRVVEEVVNVFGIIVYEADRRLFYAIPSWSDHQRTERKAKSKFPAPEDGKNVTDQWSEGTSDAQRRKLRELPTQGGGTSRKLEHRNRGRGERISATSDTTTDQEPTSPTTEPTPSSEPDSSPASLEELARLEFRREKAPGVYGNADDPRCADHVALAEAPPCHNCRRAREWFTDNQQNEIERARAQRRATIDACDLCDDNGIRTITGGATRCDHTPEHENDLPPWEQHA